MRRTAYIGISLALLSFLSAAEAQDRAVLESDALFWVPTVEQAVEMAKATGKPIFSMGSSLVPDGTTYTKKGDDCPKGVF